MNCQKCGRREATVHRRSTVFRQKIQEHLCGWCAGTGVDESDLGGKRSRRTYVCVGPSGQQLGPPTEVADPISIPNGLSALSEYVSRFLASSATFTHLKVFNLRGTAGFGLVRKNRESQLVIIVDQLNQSEPERGLRGFFSSRKILPTSDYLAGNGTVSNAIRILVYPLPDIADSITALCADLSASCFGISPNETLNYALEG
jgi:hypothetical protein